MNTSKILMPFKRELWEYKGSFIGLPLIISGLVVFFAVFGLIQLSGSDEAIYALTNNGLNLVLDETDNAQFPTAHFSDGKLAPFVYGFLSFFIWLSTLVSIYYLLGSLYDDRKDRSILFWKSMPVSEFQNVLTKFVTALFIVPIIALIVAFLTGLVLALIGGVWLSSLGVDSFSAIWSELGIFSAFFYTFVFSIVTSVWVAPFFGWILFVSSISTKPPILLAVVPPLVLIILERMFLGSSYFLAIIGNYIPDFSHVESIAIFGFDTLFLAMTKSFLTDISFWFGMVLTVGFVAGSIWFRNNRYEL